MDELLTGEIARGDGLGVAEAARRFPPARADRPCHPATVTRWMLHGVRTRDGRTVRLEGVRCGGRWVTSEAAIERFLLAQREPTPHTQAARPSARQDAVERELAELGVG
jgi:hypothetical protein